MAAQDTPVRLIREYEYANRTYQPGDILTGCGAKHARRLVEDYGLAEYATDEEIAAPPEPHRASDYDEVQETDEED